MMTLRSPRPSESRRASDGCVHRKASTTPDNMIGMSSSSDGAFAVSVILRFS
jgi:hypothetical protein